MCHYAVFFSAFCFNSFWPCRIEHHCLWSATGMPHSTQTWTRCFGGSLLPSNRLRNDMKPPFSLIRLTDAPGSRLSWEIVDPGFLGFLRPRETTHCRPRPV